ncbi:Hsp20/alpha crystallin family protein [Haloferax mediterranei ATCC 33500]|uniref:Hsp20 type chaperone n=1 Tax=Haloferax mediterranei (strain ATCC 33500 / DSM 1411 / JCM 8866 / NBRC 14739 / NCIMB 2177 / R-4) TaxID=523841 RepID=I3R2I7_HALMT|nr:Hsp20 family protein [Haloferax mediterranei]AFK18447.1 hsp20 type chaperone [Haloferax mediterranei ATCC 33500]AHZ22165.1 molecular chaperone Hsp20 [Haloferax mediterranei ATCC 33500]EMA02278.1 hsp20 type chaperone [Haloferax mediterranei ATCC 33500]MDX5988539.1 Hsp20 family protein [Haloferax mediterranei ATCC 33500]QCQ74954.1 Hsp20/alpha crystallin family protein [Haloferax mediterranei ATCC 33500]
MSDLRKFGESAANAVLERVGRGVSQMQEYKPLAYDLLESEDAYLVVFDAPGARAEDVQVRFLDGEVEIRIDRFRDFHEGFEMRFPGRGLTLSGSAALPSDAAVEAAEGTATVNKNGTLEIRIPKDGRASDIAVTEQADEEETRDEEETTPDEASEDGFGDVDGRDA